MGILKLKKVNKIKEIEDKLVENTRNELLRDQMWLDMEDGVRDRWDVVKRLNTPTHSLKGREKWVFMFNNT